MIRDATIKETIGALYKRAWVSRSLHDTDLVKPAPGTGRERFERMLAAAEYLAARIRTSGSSIYPAVQNMLLAGRALGLGATLTTLYLQFEKEAEAALGLPPNVHSYALLPIGYPWAGLDPSVVSLLPMLSMGTGGGQPCGL